MQVLIGGSIGLGKTSLTGLLGDYLGYDVFYEPINSPLLREFYEASPEEVKEKHIFYLLQLEFLRYGIVAAADAAKLPNSIIDRSVYENQYFTKVNNDLGWISDLEYSIYQDMVEVVMDILDTSLAQQPTLMVYLHGSFETMLERIAMRSRNFEQDPELMAYYKRLWEGYDAWIDTYYGNGHIIRLDMDNLDIVNNPADASYVCQVVEMKIKEITDSLI